MSTPIELASAPRWLCWRLEADPKKWMPSQEEFYIYSHSSVTR